jgi:hypothetical protein
VAYGRHNCSQNFKIGEGKQKETRTGQRSLISRQAGDAIGKVVGFAVALPGNARDGKLQAPGQLAANPIQGIQPRTPARIFAAHLTDDHVGIRKNMQRMRFAGEGPLQSLHQGYVLGYIVVLPADPLGDADATSPGIFYDDADAGRAGASVGTAVHVRY